MFDIAVTEEVIAYARSLVGRGNFGHRRSGNGDQEQQVTGLIGQTVIHDLFGIPRPELGEGADGGVDFIFEGLSIDVKTMGRTVCPQPDHVCVLFQAQKRTPTDVLLFCSWNRQKSILTVCGWMRKSEFISRGTLIPKRTERTRSDGSTFVTRAAQYELPHDQLNSASTIEELTEALAQEGLVHRGRTGTRLQRRPASPSGMRRQ